MTTYDDVADAYSRMFDPEGSGLDDPVLRELTAARLHLVHMREAHHPASDQSGVPALLYGRAVSRGS